LGLLGDIAKERVLAVQEFTLLSTRALGNIFRSPHYGSDIIRQMDFIGFGSLPIVVLTGFFTGAVLALQTATTLATFGETSLTGQLVMLSLIRELQPKILLIPHSVERHPDHVHTHILCKEAWFYAGLTKLATKRNGKVQAAYRPDSYFEYMQWHHFTPTFIVNISDTFATKMESIRAHASQFHNPKSKEPQTRLSRPDFFDRVETDDKFYGQRIGVQYGEPFYSYASIGVRNPFDLLMNKK